MVRLIKTDAGWIVKVRLWLTKGSVRQGVILLVIVVTITTLYVVQMALLITINVKPGAEMWVLLILVYVRQ